MRRVQISNRDFPGGATVENGHLDGPRMNRRGNSQIISLASFEPDSAEYDGESDAARGGFQVHTGAMTFTQIIKTRWGLKKSHPH